MAAKTDAELAKLLADTRGALREVRFAAAGSRPSDPSALHKLRTTVARTLTELRARALRAA